jgi:hypothetical protein
LNVVPCWSLDGHVLLRSLLQQLLPDRVASAERRELLLSLVLAVHSVVLALVVVFAIVRVSLGF